MAESPRRRAAPTPSSARWPATYALDNNYTPHYAVGYLAAQIQPRLAMATHLSFDYELTGEMMSGIRRHYGGLFAFGIDNVVVNVTKDRIWIPEAALPETANIARPEIDPAGFTPPEQMRPWACSADPEITM